MPLIYAYPDAYLAKFATDEREARAVADVALRATTGRFTFSAAWTERLVITQCYVLACLENQADADDLFTAKLKSYRSQFDALLPQAIAAAAATAGTVGGFGLFSVPLERA